MYVSVNAEQIPAKAIKFKPSEDYIVDAFTHYVQGNNTNNNNNIIIVIIIY